MTKNSRILSCGMEAVSLGSSGFIMSRNRSSTSCEKKARISGRDQGSSTAHKVLSKPSLG